MTAKVLTKSMELCLPKQLMNIPTEKELIIPTMEKMATDKNQRGSLSPPRWVLFLLYSSKCHSDLDDGLRSIDHAVL